MKARFLAGLVLLVMALTSCDETTETIGSSLTDNMDFLKITTDFSALNIGIKSL